MLPVHRSSHRPFYFVHAAASGLCSWTMERLAFAGRRLAHKTMDLSVRCIRSHFVQLFLTIVSERNGRRRKPPAERSAVCNVHAYRVLLLPLLLPCYCFLEPAYFQRSIWTSSSSSSSSSSHHHHHHHRAVFYIIMRRASEASRFSLVFQGKESLLITGRTSIGCHK